VDLGTTPLYVRAGAVIPTGPVRQYTAEKVDAPLLLTVYAGADGEATLYEDDGETFNFRKGEFMRLQMRWTDASRRLELRLVHGSKLMHRDGVKMEIALAGTATTKSVLFKGEPLSVTL
jgi:alpha-glucosidase (family GH31 glycosyl hydrolase)